MDPPHAVGRRDQPREVLPIGLLPVVLALAAAVPSGARAEDPPAPQREFHAVLDGLLGDFEAEIRNGRAPPPEASGTLKDVAIREVRLGEGIPSSFAAQLEAFVTERILKAARTRVAQCLACKARRVTGGKRKITITSPLTDPAERARVAREAGIRSFLDVSLTAMKRSMTLSFALSDAETGRAIWARTYGSEGERISPNAPLEGTKRVMQYRPAVQYRATLYSMFQPDISGAVFCLGAGFRMVERYDNRRKEIGFELDFFKETATLTGASAQATSLYGGLNLTLLILHGWNFLGDVEDYNQPRMGVVAGIGGTFASNFLGLLGRVGVEFRLGRHTAVSASLGYRPASQLLLASTSTLTSVAGFETGAGVSYLF